MAALPNHVVGKGMVRKIKDRQPQANIVCVDYDPGATRINQENRIKLMLANARASGGKAGRRACSRRRFPPQRKEWRTPPTPRPAATHS